MCIIGIKGFIVDVIKDENEKCDGYTSYDVSILFQNINCVLLTLIRKPVCAVRQVEIFYGSFADDEIH